MYGRTTPSLCLGTPMLRQKQWAGALKMLLFCAKTVMKES